MMKGSGKYEKSRSLIQTRRISSDWESVLGLSPQITLQTSKLENSESTRILKFTVNIVKNEENPRQFYVHTCRRSSCIHLLNQRLRELGTLNMRGYILGICTLEGHKVGVYVVMADTGNIRESDVYIQIYQLRELIEDYKLVHSQRVFTEGNQSMNKYVGETRWEIGFQVKHMGRGRIAYTFPRRGVTVLDWARGGEVLMSIGNMVYEIQLVGELYIYIYDLGQPIPYFYGMKGNHKEKENSSIQDLPKPENIKFSKYSLGYYPTYNGVYLANNPIATPRHSKTPNYPSIMLIHPGENSSRNYMTKDSEKITCIRPLPNDRLMYGTNKGNLYIIHIQIHTGSIIYDHEYSFQGISRVYPIAHWVDDIIFIRLKAIKSWKKGRVVLFDTKTRVIIGYGNPTLHRLNLHWE